MQANIKWFLAILMLFLENGRGPPVHLIRTEFNGVEENYNTLFTNLLFIPKNKRIKNTNLLCFCKTQKPDLSVSLGSLLESFRKECREGSFS